MEVVATGFVERRGRAGDEEDIEQLYEGEDSRPPVGEPALQKMA